jgi:hypothetical protein
VKSTAVSQRLGCSFSINHKMPRQVAEKNLPSLPSAADDPVERRRLLNILAQRRYSKCRCNSV